MKRFFVNHLIVAALAVAVIAVSMTACGGSDSKMTMTLQPVGEVEILMGGKGKVTIDWGDGTPWKKAELEGYRWFLSAIFGGGGLNKPEHKFSHVYSDKSACTITINGKVTHLRCSELGLKSLDVSKNKKLKHLVCNKNKLDSLVLSKNIKMENLIYDKDVKLSGNEVTVEDAKGKKHKVFDVDLFSMSGDNGTELFYAILIIFVLTFIIRRIEPSTWVGYTGLLFMAVIEIIYFLVMEQNIWFCYPGNVGWGWALLNIFLYSFVMTYQFHLFLAVIEELDNSSANFPNISLGILALIAVFFLFIISFFFTDIPYEYPYAIHIIVGSIVFIQVIFIFAKKHYKSPFKLSLLFISSVAGIMPALVYFVPLIVVIWITKGFLKVASIPSSGGGSESDEIEQSERIYDNEGNVWRRLPTGYFQHINTGEIRPYSKIFGAKKC